MLAEADRRIVAALAVNGRASWARIARVLDVSETTVARRAERLLAAGIVRVMGVPDPLACGFGQPVLAHLRCAPGAVRRVADALAARPDARFVTVLTGYWDVIVEIIASNRDHLTRILVDEIQALDGVEETSTETVLRTFKTTYDWSRDLLGERAGEIAPAVVETSGGSVVLDDVDLGVIAELGEDGRTSYAGLAARLGVSESVAARRVGRLISHGCLRFATLVDPEALGFSVEAFIRLSVDLPRLEEAAAALCEQTPARYVSVTTGASDLVCEAVLHDPQELYGFITGPLAALPGLRHVETSMELQTLKRAFRPRAGATPSDRTAV